MSNRLQNTWLCAVSLILTCLFSTGAAASSVYDIEPGKRLYLNDSAPFLSVTPVPSTINEVVGHYLDRPELWKMAPKVSFLQSLNPAFAWQKITVHNPTKRTITLFLACEEPSLQHLSVALLRNGEVQRQWYSGNEVPYTQRPIQYRFFLVPFSLKAGETATLIAGLETSSARKNLWIEGQDHFWENDSTRQVFDGAYFGAICTLSLLILILFLVHRNITYLYFYLFVFFSGLHNLLREGYLQSLIPHQAVWLITPFILISLNLLFAFAVVFSLHFLEFRLRGKRLTIYLAYIYFAVNTASIVAAITLPPPVYIPLGVISALIAIALLLFYWLLSIVEGLQGHPRSRFFAFAILLYIVPTLAYAAYIYSYNIDTGPLWLSPRNGEVLMAVALYAIQMLELRREQLEKQAALAAARARTHLFATMSHELRTPLNGVIGMAELLHQTNQTPTQRQYSDVIVSSGNVLLTLINDILDLTKISEGKLEFEEKSYDLDQIVAECAASFVPLMLEKNLPVLIRLQAGMPFQYLGDQYRIRQLIFNLLNNAIKFTEEGHVMLAVSAEPAQEAGLFKITLVVSDTGVGIDPQSHDRIFEQFSQADASTTRRFGGSGLGLAICKSIAESMGGSIRLESELNKGSTFTVEYLAKIDADVQQKCWNTLFTLKGKRILMVGDYPTYCQERSQHMAFWGVQATVARDWDNAIEQLRQAAFDAIVIFPAERPWRRLEQFTPFNLPILVLHHLTIGQQNSDWTARVRNLPVPSPVQKFGLTILSLFEEDSNTNIESNPEAIGREKTGTNILVAEDNITNQMVILGMLKNLGYTAEVAEDGIKAVEMCRQKAYDLIFMDCEMPGMDGYEATEKILQQAQNRKPVIVAFTAQPMDISAERCKQAGMSYTLYKPLTVKQLKNCLEEFNIPCQ